ncbi:hypothetical protein GCM10023187_13140 [Nibrella viscosa]|uniref:Bacterial sugar transferase domain-containing protein n=1 Tax=Nibrella viscosa TaxID=1084524 RepID=A0ABP8K4W3_9BACT
MAYSHLLTVAETQQTSNPYLSLSDKLQSYGYQKEDLQKISDVTAWLNGHSALLDELAGSPTTTYATVFTGRSLNQVTDISGLLRHAFSYIQPDGFLVCHLELSDQRKSRLFGSSPIGLAYLWYVFDYLLHRVAPRLSLTRSLYKSFFPAKRVLSRAETLGRFVHAGYTISTSFESGGQFFVVAGKTGAETVQRPPSPEGVLLHMWRIGKHGRPFRVYKIRTMHPYSEYLQEYMHQLNGLEAGGKFKDDFRVISPGRFMRKYWLDEIPMLINLLKGDIKLVGVRPLSAQYFNLYPEEAKQERIKHKPGLFPPYYADLPRNFEEIVESELRYLRAYSQAPLKTDATYLLRILYNIVWKRARSK